MTSVGIAVRSASGFERGALYFLFRKEHSTFLKETCRGSHGVGCRFVEPHGYIDGKAFRAMICLRGFCVLGTKKVSVKGRFGHLSQRIEVPPLGEGVGGFEIEIIR